MADVFISYSHTSTQLATALQRALTRLGRPWNRPRALQVFRDKTDLSGLWDVSTGDKLAEFPTEVSTTVVFNPNGNLIALRPARATVDIVDWRSRRTVIQFSDIDVLEEVLTFSRSGKHLASSGGQIVHLWQTSTGQKADLRGHTGQVLAAAFSPSDDTVATAGEDHTVRIWDLATGAMISVLQGGHSGAIRALRFRPDGTLVSIADDHAISLWDTRILSRDLIGTACEQAASGFTDDERNEFLSGYGEIQAC